MTTHAISSVFCSCHCDVTHVYYDSMLYIVYTLYSVCSQIRKPCLPYLITHMSIRDEHMPILNWILKQHLRLYADMCVFCTTLRASNTVDSMAIGKYMFSFILFFCPFFMLLQKVRHRTIEMERVYRNEKRAKKKKRMTSHIAQKQHAFRGR